MTKNPERIKEVSEAIADLGYKGIIKFDKEEPEYKAFKELSNRFQDKSYLYLLGISTGLMDYQLNGDAQLYWKTLKETSKNKDSLESIDDVKELMDQFMDKDVNARLNKQKRNRLNRLLNSEFPSWFINNHRDTEPIRVWNKLAESMNNKKDIKTIVFSMKVYDLIHLIQEEKYLDFPKDIPIPCDVHVKRVAKYSGIVDRENDELVKSAWADVAEKVRIKLDKSISLLRIDSIIWQLGQIISKNKNNVKECRNEVKNYLKDIGIDSETSKKLSKELTLNL